MNKKTIARIDVRETLIALIEARDHFRTALLNEHELPAWCMDEEHSGKGCRELAASASLKLTYEPDQKGQETIKLPGLVGISASTLELGIQLNTCKDAFKNAMKIFRSCFWPRI